MEMEFHRHAYVTVLSFADVTFGFSYYEDNHFVQTFMAEKLN